MIGIDKVNLPACAFGAGLAHVAALALVLPILITLPAPGGEALRLVAIPVEILAETPPPPVSAAPALEAPALDAIGELVARAGIGSDLPPGPADFAPEADDVTYALPRATAEPEPEAEAEPAEQDAIAAVDANPPPLPVRVDRDAAAARLAPPKAAPPPVKRAAPKPAPVARPAPRRPVAARPDIVPYKDSWEVLLGKPAFKPAPRPIR
ncbi:MAG: hypothetical protein ACRECX_03570 [Methyloceanibacter sp.]|uniref:hypothetical protein n=1 Tax=Methyloceanibacter sp. TaxID=1965321 RepID=UPI003D6D0CD8